MRDPPRAIGLVRPRRQYQCARAIEPLPCLNVFFQHIDARNQIPRVIGAGQLAGTDAQRGFAQAEFV